MNKKEVFISEIEKIKGQLSKEAQEYFDEFKTAKVGVPKAITDKGKEIVKDMQDNPAENYKAKDIAERLGTTGRSVSGSIRSLIALGYVVKTGEDPVTYALTELGKNFEL